MLKYSTKLYHRQKGYEVRSIISFSGVGQVVKDIPGALHDIRDQLEHTLPGKYKAKYKISQEEMVIIINLEKPGEAQGLLYKLDDFIKRAANSLKLKH